ncbi:MAG: hypothetical protein R3E97_07630 [Candidatus Eisenbacteria bacterium]
MAHLDLKPEQVLVGGGMGTAALAVSTTFTCTCWTWGSVVASVIA